MRETGWLETAIGGIITEAGNSVDYETGSWRTLLPLLDSELCTHCMICWIFCPDSSVLVEDGKVIGFDLKHCKGCSICAAECPRKAIAMVEETLVVEGV